MDVASLTAAKSGGIPGYRNLMVNPVDIMALLEFGQPTGEAKNTSAWG